MGNKGIDARIECPFFKENIGDSIICESCIPEAKHIFKFKRAAEKRKYIENVCCVNSGKKCLHYRNMAVLYERGVMPNERQKKRN